MKKLPTILLLVLLAIVSLAVACKNDATIPDSNPDTTTNIPKATTEQLFLLHELYRQSFLNMDVTTAGVSLDNDVYTFSDVDNYDTSNILEGKLSGTFKDTGTEISINVSFKDSVGGKTYTVSGTIERNGKDAEITINGEKCLIHKHQVPPYQDPTQSIPEANPTQRSNFINIFLYVDSINRSATPPEGFTKKEETYLYENVKVLDEDGNVKGILNGEAKGGAYLNITYEEANGGINTIIIFFKETAPSTFVIFINGKAYTVTLG